jgi:general secretion pathway protein L
MTSARLMTDSSPRVPSAQRRPPPFAGFARWWLAEARGLAGLWRPDPAAAARADRLVVVPGESDVTLEWRRAKGGLPVSETVARSAMSAKTLAAFLRKTRAPRSAPVFLAPPPALVFAHRMLLPTEAAEAAPELVADVVRRKTPLNPDQFHAASAVEPSPDNPGKSVLRIGLVPKAWVADQLRMVGMTGDQVAGLLVSDGAEPPLQASLASRRGRSGAAWAGALAVVAVLGGLGATGWAAWQLHDEGRRLDEQVARIAPKARETLQLNRTAGEARGLVEAIRARKDNAGLLKLWRELTVLMPPDTWVLDLQVNDREVAITGYSSSASSLIQKLEASTLLTDVALTGSVVFDNLEAKERFTLRATFRQPQPPLDSLR